MTSKETGNAGRLGARLATRLTRLRSPSQGGGIEPHVGSTRSAGRLLLPLALPTPAHFLSVSEVHQLKALG